MARVIRLAVFVATTGALAACASPTAPSPLACNQAKIPYASCPTKDYINPNGDYINPNGDYINPNGDAGTDTTSHGGH
jgi:hypothetical protein